MNIQALSRLLLILLLAALVAVTGCTTTGSSSGDHDATGQATVDEASTMAVPPQPPPPYRGKAEKRPATPPSVGQPVPPAPPPVVGQATAQIMAAPRFDAMRSRTAGIVMPSPYWPGAIDHENYKHYDDNPVHLAVEQPVSTFSIDVDTGSYTNVRRMLNEGRLPPADAVRAEEFINYFDYGYTPPADHNTPFSVTTEMAPAPWNAKRQLLLVGIQGYRVPQTEVPAANLVFLIDTSGSMNQPDKLPLLQAALKQLVPQLRGRDHVAIVTYAGSAGVALKSTPGDRHARIVAAIDRLAASGSTNGEAGLKLAYNQARQGFIEGGINRVILATDGDFNVGQTGIEALKDEIANQRRGGIALSTLGFGQGNYNDAMAVQLADVGNGSHHYIDSLLEARKVLVDEMSATLLTIASDVKIQIEFNPAKVREYRLIGYVKRMLKREDFNNDSVDAGEIGAGANVTALYEITPAGSGAARIDPLRYGKQVLASGNGNGNELAFLRLRYKLPGQSHSRLIERPITDADVHAGASDRLRFAAAAGAFAEALRGGSHLDGYTMAQIAELARGARGNDPYGYRAGLAQLVGLADGLRPPVPAPAPDAESTAIIR